MHREVNLTKRVQTLQGMRYCAVVLSANGRVKPDAVLVNGKPERHPEGGSTSNGTTRAGADAYRWARTQPMPVPCACGRRPS